MNEKIESHPLHDAASQLTFPPSPEFMQQANYNNPAIYAAAAADPLQFWADKARELSWHKPFTTTLTRGEPHQNAWFADGELNVAYNCLDRHVAAGNGDRVALFFEGEPGDTATITYKELSAQVQQAANMLASLGVRQGDRVAIYLPMIPEAVISMLAVARLGAIHSVIFGGFSAESLSSRIIDAGAKVVITADGGYRKGRITPLKDTVDAALRIHSEHLVQHVLVVQRCGNEVQMQEHRDLWWHEELVEFDSQHKAQGFSAENPLFILYTSGTTGKPKGILHTSGGYLTQVCATMHSVFDIKPERDVYWCTADVGWITGHSYVVYGPLACGATQVIYEGAPDTPDWSRWWQIVERYGVTILYTAPTAIRACMRVGRQIPLQHNLRSLRLLGSVGEPINPEAWRWYHEVIGGGRCPIVDTWWQTETGAIMAAPLPGIAELQPGSAQTPLPGISIKVLDDDGAEVPQGAGGLLAITEPWPSMARTIWGDEERFYKTYWQKFSGAYFAGDGARFDEHNNLWLLGRVDDVLNVSGHRLSTAEIESALVEHHAVAEAAVIGVPDETTGEAVIAFVILKSRQHLLTAESAPAELSKFVAAQIGAIARPKQVHVVAELPKTRSGKIMRRLLRDAAAGKAIGDTTTLADTVVMQVITAQMQQR